MSAKKKAAKVLRDWEMRAIFAENIDWFMEKKQTAQLTPREKLKAAKARKAKAVEEMKQILTDICIKQTGKAPTSFQVL